MGEWLVPEDNMILSRRDRLIVSRHEVPGSDAGEPRPGGTIEVMFIPHQIVSLR
jgi:hypothetical protein